MSITASAARKSLFPLIKKVSEDHDAIETVPSTATPSSSPQQTSPPCGKAPIANWKALSQRIGHADVAFTMKRYVQADLVADRQVATTLAELIIGGSLASTEATTDETQT